MKLIPKNWDSFQHYKDRNPPWIKLHKGLLNDRAYARLPLASKALAPLLWLLASESKDGSFDADVEELTFRLHMTEKEITQGLNPLIKSGFFMPVQSDSGVLAEGLQVAPKSCSETEGETEAKREGEAPAGARASYFDEFWKAYPKKVGKDAAIKAFDKRKPTRELLDLMLAAIAVQRKLKKWIDDGGQYIPHPSTWLNEGRWQDEVDGGIGGFLKVDPDSREAIEAEGIAKGIGPWDQTEQFPLYKARVRGARPAAPLDLNVLGSMAAQRAGVH